MFKQCIFIISKLLQNFLIDRCFCFPPTATGGVRPGAFEPGNVECTNTIKPFALSAHLNWTYHPLPYRIIHINQEYCVVVHLRVIVSIFLFCSDGFSRKRTKLELIFTTFSGVTERCNRGVIYVSNNHCIYKILHLIYSLNFALVNRTMFYQYFKIEHITWEVFLFIYLQYFWPLSTYYITNIIALRFKHRMLVS